ncbi:hypothetical protein ACH518_10225 [Methylomonas sp. HW2-6]|uniref:hypothetical protein n=1 Tax=Methylomonas sp. HW2-6 TaxID=3376687 RepID=UPI004041AAA3
MKPLLYIVAAACVMAIPPAANAAAYKCTVVGKVVYQQSPCAGEGKAVKIDNDTEEKKLNRQMESQEAARRRQELDNMAKGVDRRNAQEINTQMQILENQRLRQEALDFHRRRAEEYRALEEESKTHGSEYMEVWGRNHAEEQEKRANELQ